MDDEHVYELFDVKGHLLEERCIVLCGNEEMYLLAYARAMVCSYFGLDETPGMDKVDGGVSASRYHYEVDYSGAEAMKSIVKNGSVSGRRRVFVIRGLAGANDQQQLKHLLDRYSATFVIVSKSVGSIDGSLLSRAMVLRLPFEQNRLSGFLERYGVEAPPRGGSVVCAVARAGRPRYRNELAKLIGEMEEEGSQLRVALGIGEFCKRCTSLCIPLADLCKAVIEELSSHPRIADVVDACARADARGCTREQMSCESMLIGVWAVIRPATKNSNKR